MLNPDPQVLLGGPVGTRLKAGLQTDGLQFVTDSGGEPVSEDVHIILEYANGEQWGAAGPASRSNRYILNYGAHESSCQMQGMEQLFAARVGFNPDIMSISGAHILEGCEPSVRTQRLTALQQCLRELPLNIPVHLEFGSIAARPFLVEVAESIFGHVDSIGLNEQELTDVYLALGGMFDDELTEVGMRGREIKNVPDVSMVCKALNFILSSLSNLGDITRKLCRVHFHCLAYHLVAEAPGSRSLFADPVRSLVRGAVVATTQAAGGEP